MIEEHRATYTCATPEVRRQAGLTLVELMISMAIGLFIVIATTALLLSTKSGYLAQDDAAHIHDTGRHAIEIISRAVRLAAYENWDAAEAPVVDASAVGANLAGLDAHSLKSTMPGISSPLAKSINGSDVLAVRFFGSGSGDNGDGTMTNCAGFGVPAASSAQTADDSRGWSIFYVAENASGEPELYCKYRGGGGWSAQSIASGVESFQVLYGLDTDADGVPNTFLTASAINGLDAALILAGADAAQRAADLNRKTHWKKVVALKVALLVRGAHFIREVSSGSVYDLLGQDYANGYAASDPGVRIKESALPKSVRGRERRVFTTTIQLRNRSVGA